MTLDEYWSEEPNYDQVRGITFERLRSLIDLHKRTKVRDLYDFGATVSLAYHDPQKLKELIRTPLDMSKLPNMLRIPKKKVTDG